MSPTVTLKGEVKFSMKKMISGAGLASSHYVGPGEVLLAPPMLGDITSIRLNGNEMWNLGHDAYLASTQGIIKDQKRQGLSKAIFSGEGLFVYKMSGTGVLWVASFGAIIRKDVRITHTHTHTHSIKRKQSDLLMSFFFFVFFSSPTERDILSTMAI